MQWITCGSPSLVYSNLSNKMVRTSKPIVIHCLILSPGDSVLALDAIKKCTLIQRWQQGSECMRSPFIAESNFGRSRRSWFLAIKRRWHANRIRHLRLRSLDSCRPQRLLRSSWNALSIGDEYIHCTNFSPRFALRLQTWEPCPACSKTLTNVWETCLVLEKSSASNLRYMFKFRNRNQSKTVKKVSMWKLFGNAWSQKSPSFVCSRSTDSYCNCSSWS